MSSKKCASACAVPRSKRPSAATPTHASSPEPVGDFAHAIRVGLHVAAADLDANAGRALLHERLRELHHLRRVATDDDIRYEESADGRAPPSSLNSGTLCGLRLRVPQRDVDGRVGPRRESREADRAESRFDLREEAVGFARVFAENERRQFRVDQRADSTGAGTEEVCEAQPGDPRVGFEMNQHEFDRVGRGRLRIGERNP